MGRAKVSGMMSKASALRLLSFISRARCFLRRSLRVRFLALGRHSLEHWLLMMTRARMMMMMMSQRRKMTSP